MMRPIWIGCRRWPFAPQRSIAITLWPFIFYSAAFSDHPGTGTHELYHWWQALRWGVVPWYAYYALLLPWYWRRAREHPLERPAYLAGYADDALTIAQVRAGAISRNPR